MSANRLYKKVVFAGTFDHLHAGHIYLLRTAFGLGERVSIGLTTDAMLESKSDRALIQSYEERYAALEHLIKSEGMETSCDIFPIDTVEGGADMMKDLEALVVSDEIKVVRNAFDINEKRAENRLKRFHIIVVPRVRTPDGRPLSSSRKRQGETFDSEDLIY
jgi:pantetheine-phosphate adenylyltransferase